MIRIAIVDDSARDAGRLEEFLRRYGEETGQELGVTRFGGAGEFLERREGFDLIIMDIDMPELNGVDAARQLRDRGDDTVLMFVTNMPQYALNGYEVEAVDYVLKPVVYSEFVLKLRKAERYIQRSRESSVALQTQNGLVKVSTADILYVESALHYLTYHMADGRAYRVRSSMTQAEADLPGGQFARCNASYLVNLWHVGAIEKEDVLVGDHRLKISRGKRMEFLEKFTKYLGGMSS